MSGLGFTADEQFPTLRRVQLGGRLKAQDKQVLLPDIKLAGSLDGQGVTGKVQAQLALDLSTPMTPLLRIQDLSLKDIEYSNNEGTLVAAGGQLSFKGQFRLDRGVVLRARPRAGRRHSTRHLREVGTATSRGCH